MPLLAQALGLSSMRMVVRDHLRSATLFISFPDRVLRGEAGEDTQGAEWWLLGFLHVGFNDTSILDFKCCTGFQISQDLNHIKTNNSKAKCVWA